MTIKYAMHTMRELIVILEQAESADYWITSQGKVIRCRESHEETAAAHFGAPDDYDEQEYTYSGMAVKQGWIRVTAYPGEFGSDTSPRSSKASLLALKKVLATAPDARRYYIGSAEFSDSKLAQAEINRRIANQS